MTTLTAPPPALAGKVSATSDPEIKQVTNVDENERFYIRLNPDGSLRAFRPSLTFVLGTCWPNQQALQSWVGDVGNDEAERIKTEAGEDGSYIHDRIQRMMHGEWTSAHDIDRLFMARRRFKIKKALHGYTQWFETVGAQPIDIETVTWCDEPGFAGTLDFRGTLDAGPLLKAKSTSCGRRTWIVDWKCGKSIHETAKAQVCAYAYAERLAGKEVDCVGILHLANTTQRGWSFLDVTPDYERFLALALHTVDTFHRHSPDARPSELVFPEVFLLKSLTPAL